MHPFRRIVLASIAGGAIASGFVMACTSEDETSATPTSEAGTASEDGATSEPEELDGASEAGKDAGRDADAAKAGKDANGPGEAGAMCSFNRECQAVLRCECDNGDCACKPGARGTGENGVDTCNSGNDCSSALCLEGPGGTYLCSDECETAADCPAKLPKCLDVTFVGRICVREP